MLPQHSKTLLEMEGDGLVIALTSRHHLNEDSLVGVGVIPIVGVYEGALECALVGACVIVSDIEDVDGAVLQVIGVLAAVPG